MKTTNETVMSGTNIGCLANTTPTTTMLNVWPKQNGFSLTELMIAVAIIGFLATVAVPNYLHYQKRTQQAEAKANLSGIYLSEAVYFAEELRYGSFSEIGFALAGTTNRYTYRSPANGGAAGSSGAAGVDLFNAGTGETSPDNTVTPSAAQLAAPVAQFTATATANIDNDGTVDQWHINAHKEDLQFPDTDDAVT